MTTTACRRIRAAGVGRAPSARRRQNPSLPQTVCKNQIAGPLRQNHSSAGAEGDKQGRVRLLQMREPSAVPVLREHLAGGHAGLIVWAGRPRTPFSSQGNRLLIFVCDM